VVCFKVPQLSHGGMGEYCEEPKNTGTMAETSLKYKSES
jgi:hypothetical protein